MKVLLPYDPMYENNQVVRDLWDGVENGIDHFNQVYTGEVKMNIINT